MPVPPVKAGEPDPLVPPAEAGVRWVPIIESLQKHLPWYQTWKRSRKFLKCQGCSANLAYITANTGKRSQDPRKREEEIAQNNWGQGWKERVKAGLVDAYIVLDVPEGSRYFIFDWDPAHNVVAHIGDL